MSACGCRKESFSTRIVNTDSMTTHAKPEPAAKPRAKRRWYQFSLWSMFVWVTVVAVLLAVGMLWIAQAQQQQQKRAAVQMVERHGSFASADCRPGGPTDNSHGRQPNAAYFRNFL